jgi:hypothetical protein
MSPQARDLTIKHFMNNVHVTVFLVSLKAGGVALNLTEANRVYLMDSWWNPAVEYRAFMKTDHENGRLTTVQRRWIASIGLGSIARSRPSSSSWRTASRAALFR